MNEKQEILIAIAVSSEIFMNLFFDDDDGDERNNEGNITRKIPKAENFAEITIPSLKDKQFLQDFRMNRDTFDNLWTKLHSVHEACFVGRQEMPLEKQLLITLWSLGNMETFRSVSDRFGVSKSSCWEILYRTCRLLLKANRRFQIICWPKEEKAMNIVTNFQRKTNFPGCLSVIDRCHIKIMKPQEYPNSYVNRKGYSVFLQGICDNQKAFTDVYAGEPGSIHDRKLFQKSHIFEMIRNHEVNFPNDTHLIGDLAYKLSTNLLVPIKNYGNLTEAQKKYNLLHSKTRVVIENAFGLLKSRFRRLKFMETTRMDLISLLIISACILHNICIFKGDFVDTEITNDEFANVQEDAGEDIIAFARPENAAIIKRNNIGNLLYLNN